MSFKKFFNGMFVSFVLLLNYSSQAAMDLTKIKLPKGFQISIFNDKVPGARSMVWGEKGTLFVGSQDEGKVYAIDGKGVVHTIAKGLNTPNGVAFRKGSLYVAEISRILQFDDIENRLTRPPKLRVVYDKLPTDRHHGWKFIAFGPDDKLYVPVGAPCNICDKGDPYATIMRMNADGSGLEIFARGIRNTVGFTWHPSTKEMWFTDNGRDMLGDDVPPDELNRAEKPGLHFGYPYCHGGELLDPQFGKGKKCDDFIKPEKNLGPHVAALGLRFYTGTQFPGEYRNQLFIAEHGSWNRSTPIGYRVMLVRLDAKGKVSSYESFAEGWLENGQVSGRPVDVLNAPDGSLLVSDDRNGVIYKVVYRK